VRRFAILVVLLCGGAGCDKATAPRQTIAGTYHVATANGAPLPFVTPPDTSRFLADTQVVILTITSETLILNSDSTGTYDVKYTADVWHTSPPSRNQVPSDFLNTGHWVLSPTTIRFVRETVSANGQPPSPTSLDTTTFERVQGSSDLMRIEQFREGSLVHFPAPELAVPFIYRKE
jgi:hypothetical protein